MCSLCQVKKLIAHEPELLERYSNSLLESYVDDNNRVKWCAVKSAEGYSSDFVHGRELAPERSSALHVTFS